jgi:hypothetical protein
MTRIACHLGSAVLALVLAASFGSGTVSAQSTDKNAASTVATQTPSPAASAASTAQARARRRAYRRRQRAAQDQSVQQQPSSAPVGETAAQRTRDAQILAAQKKQSDAIARENDTLTHKFVEEQQRQQAEPRIQEAPGPGSTPLAGDPAIMPPQTSESPRVQDAPGPAQTLPKAPPPTSEPAPAPAPSPEH